MPRQNFCAAGGARYNIYANAFGGGGICDDGMNWGTATGFCGSAVPITLTVRPLDHPSCGARSPVQAMR